MSDDLGAWALGASGCKDFRTPHLDALAAGGARFTNAFACTPVCSASRMTFFTGKLPSHHGVQFHLVAEDSGPAARRMLDGHLTFSEVLAAHGYTLGLSGKWHMGGDLHPHAGFNYWRVLHGVRYRNPEVVIEGQRRKVPGFKSDLEGDYALEFIERNKQRPFCLFLSQNAPHRDYDYQPPGDRKPYLNSRLSCFPRLAMHPWHNPNRQLMGDHGNRESQISYAALVTGLDRNVGRVLRRLEELRLRENTLVIFTSDNGYNAGHHGVWGKGSGTVPFNLYEESVRLPLIWSHPGAIPAATVVPQMVSSYDFFPSLIDYLGLKAPPDARRVGASYAPFLRRQPASWPNRVYFEYAYTRGVRTANLKYVERTSDWPSEMYDLEADPQESRNVIEDPAYRGPASALRAGLADYFARAAATPLEDWRSTTKQVHPEYSTERLPWYPLNQPRK